MSDRKKETILITGAAGFVGRAVAKALRAAGKRLVLVDSAYSAEFPCVVCDVSDAAQVRRVFESEHIDGIVHLAAILPTAAQKDSSRATRVNVHGSLNLLTLAREFGVRRFVFGSSLSIYGTCPKNVVVSESYHATPEDHYGETKLIAEVLGQSFAEMQRMEFVSLRIGRVIGAGARSTTSAWRSEIFELLRARDPVEIRIPYVASERILLVHVEDVARAVVSLVEADRLEHRVYNAPCESVVVGELKGWVEGLNSKIKVIVGDREAEGNPRRADWSRFRGEFGFEVVPVVERLRRASTANLSG